MPVFIAEHMTPNMELGVAPTMSYFNENPYPVVIYRLLCYLKSFYQVSKPMDNIDDFSRDRTRCSEEKAYPN